MPGPVSGIHAFLVIH